MPGPLHLVSVGSSYDYSKAVLLGLVPTSLSIEPTFLLIEVGILLYG